MKKQKKLLVSELTNRIYLTEAKEIGEGRYISAGEQKDFTDEAVRAVFEWFMAQIKNTENAKGYAVRFEGVPYVLEMHEAEENNK